MVALEDIVYVVDENLLRMGKAMVAVRRDTALWREEPLDALLPEGIDDPDWIPVVGDRGWVVITNDKRIRTRPVEAQMAIDHHLKVIHLEGSAGHATAWQQLVRLAKRWEAIEDQVVGSPVGPWWLSVRSSRTVVMRYEPGKVER